MRRCGTCEAAMTRETRKRVPKTAQTDQCTGIRVPDVAAIRRRYASEASQSYFCLHHQLRPRSGWGIVQVVTARPGSVNMPDVVIQAPTAAPPPFWVAAPDGTEGVDILGLRGPVQAIGNELMDGVTSVARRVRFLSLTAWTADRFRHSALPKDKDSFDRFTEAVETALVVGHVLNGTAPTYLNGKSAVGDAHAAAEVPLERLVATTAANQFRGPASMLGLVSVEGDLALPTKPRGLDVARAFEAAVGATAFARRLAADPGLRTASRAELSEFAAAAPFVAVDRADEADALLDALLPDAPRDKEGARERNRVATLALLLWLSAPHRRRIHEADLFAAAERPPDGLPPTLRPALDGWLEYRVRDSLSVTGEASFKAVRDALRRQAGPGRAPCAAESVLHAVASDTAAHERALAKAGLLEDGQPCAGMTMADLRRLARERAGAPVPGSGPRRWAGPLSEERLMEAARRGRAGAGAVALLPLAFVLASERIPGGPEAAGMRFLGIPRPANLCLTGTVLPLLRDLERENTSLEVAAARLAQRMVDQHLRVAWSRLRTSRHDIALLLTDGPDWTPRPLDINPDRTDSRIDRALDWLEQLGAIAGDGLTARGGGALDRALAVLERVPAPDGGDAR